VGAAVYAAAIRTKPPDASDRRCDFRKPHPSVYVDYVTAVLSDDHLSPLLARMLLAEPFQQVWPHPVANFDRQLGLEWSLERSFLHVFGRDTLSEPLYALKHTAEAPSVPYLLLNVTRVRDGRRLIMSPLYVQTEQHGGADDWHAIDYLNGPPLSAAAGTGARFPFISPPGYFISRNVKVDGPRVMPDEACCAE
jgi:hypothetical protein